MSSQSLTTRFLPDTGAQARNGGLMRSTHVQRRERPHGAGLWAIIVGAYRRHRSRAALARLDATMLKDIGVSFAEAEREANKPFWRA